MRDDDRRPVWTSLSDNGDPLKHSYYWYEPSVLPLNRPRYTSTAPPRPCSGHACLRGPRRNLLERHNTHSGVCLMDKIDAHRPRAPCFRSPRRILRSPPSDGPGATRTDCQLSVLDSVMKLTLTRMTKRTHDHARPPRATTSTVSPKNTPLIKSLGPLRASITQIWSFAIECIPITYETPVTNLSV
jgi:hypothetical protein